MRIAVLGWGSLIWDPKDFKNKIKHEDWYVDGPKLPIEFARLSTVNLHKLTLVIVLNASFVTTLWNEMIIDSIEEAVEQLRLREGCPTARCIGFLALSDNNNVQCRHGDTILGIIREWAIKKDLDAVIWTDLETNFLLKKEKPLSKENVIEHLQNLRASPDLFIEAKDYIINTPKQVQTDFRSGLEESLI